MLAGTIGALLAQGLTPFAAARLGVYLHGLAGDAVRERFGDAGLLASDLPDAIALARKRLAATPSDARPAGRLGFGARDRRAGDGDGDPAAAGAPRPVARRPRARPEPAPRAERGPDRTRDAPGSRSASPRPGCRRCHGPPGSRSTSTRSPRNLASLRDAGRARRPRSSPSSRPTPTATARSRSPGRWRRPAPTACASRPSTRRWSCGTAGVAGADPRAVPVPPALGARRRARGGSPSAAGRPRRCSDALVERPRPRRAGRARPLGVQLEVETGLGRGGFAGRRASRRPRPIARRAGRRGWPASGRTSRRPRTPRGRPAQVDRFERGLRALAGAGRCALPAPPPRGERGAAGRATSPAYDARPARARHLRPRPGRRRSDAAAGVAAGDLRPVHVAARPAGPRRRPARPATGISYGPTFVTARPSRIATLPRRLWRRLAALTLEPGGGARPRRRVPLVGNVAMDAVMADVTDVPGPPVTIDDEFVLLGRQGDERDHGRGAGADAHHEHAGRWSRPCLGDCPGCTMPRPDRWVFGRSRLEGLLGAHRALERRYLRPRGRRDRERRPTRRSGCRPASAARSSAPAATRSSSPRSARRPSRSATRSSRPAGALAARARDPRGVARSRPAHERAGHRGGRPQRDGPRPRASASTSLAFPALGTGVGGFPLDEAARIAVSTVRDELPRSPTIEHVIFALRGAAAYDAFAARAWPSPHRARRATAGHGERVHRVNLPYEPRRAARRARRAGRPRDPAPRADRARRSTSCRPAGRTGRSARTRCCSSTRSSAACSAASSPGHGDPGRRRRIERSSTGSRS